MCIVFDADGNAIFCRILTENCEFIQSERFEQYQCVRNEIYFFLYARSKMLNLFNVILWKLNIIASIENNTTCVSIIFKANWFSIEFLQNVVFELKKKITVFFSIILCEQDMVATRQISHAHRSISIHGNVLLDTWTKISPFLSGDRINFATIVGYIHRKRRKWRMDRDTHYSKKGADRR